VSNIASVKFKIEGWPTTFYEYNANNNVLKYEFNDEKANRINKTHTINADFYDKVEEITKNWVGMYNNYNVKGNKK